VAATLVPLKSWFAAIIESHILRASSGLCRLRIAEDGTTNDMFFLKTNILNYMNT
jgi:hypothetical protein